LINKPVIIIGTGGHAKVIADMAKLLGMEILGFVSPNVEVGASFCGSEILGDDLIISSYSSEKINLINGIGALPGKNLRQEVSNRMREQGYSFATVVHPNAIISTDVELDEGVQVMAGAIIQTSVKIGMDTIVNTGAIIDHDCYIEENCHIAPGSVLSGGVVVKNGSYIGSGAKIIQCITINDGCTIAAGTTVYANVPSKMLVRQRLDTRLKKIDFNHA
jgi:sugar O-acyltransferase (sialic acid O-acetyltransferase NeuD family)